METATWLILGLLIGGVIGAVATWLISRARGGAVSVMQLKQENDKFRGEVTEHFVETARLINQMTDSYKAVFDHLSSGAENLVDEKSLSERLPPASGQEVRLSQFGSSSSANPARDSSKQSSTPSSEQSKDESKSQSKTAGGAAESGASPANKQETSQSRPDPLKRARTGDAAASRQTPDTSRPASSGDGKNDTNAKSNGSDSKPGGPARASDKPGASAPSAQAGGKPGARD